MSTTTTTAKRSDCARYTSHSLDELAGYVVVRTIAEGGESLVRGGKDRGEVLATFERAGDYLAALEVAKAHRVRGGYAVVRDLSGCPVCDPITRAGGEPHFELA
jgi:hypothetical protein